MSAAPGKQDHAALLLECASGCLYACDFGVLPASSAQISASSSSIATRFGTQPSQQAGPAIHMREQDRPAFAIRLEPSHFRLGEKSPTRSASSRGPSSRRSSSTRYSRKQLVRCMSLKSCLILSPTFNPETCLSLAFSKEYRPASARRVTSDSLRVWTDYQSQVVPSALARSPAATCAFERQRDNRSQSLAHSASAAGTKCGAHSRSRSRRSSARVVVSLVR